MPRFAVLEHRRDGVHWDFLLEHGEVLRRWSRYVSDPRSRLPRMTFAGG